MIVSFILALALQENADGYATCNQAEADKGIQIEMNICAAEEFARADAAMNVQWKKTAEVMKQRDEDFDNTYDDRPGYFETLLKAQRAWLEYRDAHCAGDGYVARGGSLEPLLISTCSTSLTEERTAQLAALIEEY